VVIGTHRLLSEDVKFKNLGLLVVDEEQRFGVQHKERIKQIRADVDVLTLTATPIPRTLELSLTGIRDLSLVNTPPEDRQAILTYVGEYDERAVAEAIRRELLREGQAFFVHNRVNDIEHVAAQLRDLVPEARIAIAHGQMDEAQLERVVLDFAEREYDVLVCTTIVESGLDMPTVNTLVVDRADLLGLAQMYQLRGRVGRRGQRAYAYLLHPTDRVLTEEAYERLKTIGEFTELGSGFKIAMRDLEIRGAGNLLGGVQSGHIAAVGFDLYCEMVTEAVGELTGERPAEPFETTIDVAVDANLPRDYVSRDDVRMEAYRRLAAVTTEADVDDIRDEWLDRYGPLPPPAEALLDVASLRAECVRLGIRGVTVARNIARLQPVELRESQKVRLRRLAPKAVAKSDGELAVPVPPRDSAASFLVTFLRELFPQTAQAPVASAAP
jgi:transcription-repair coupling factor (superfamily II helicase)